MQPDTQTAAAFPEKWRSELGTSVPDVALNAKAGWEQEFVAVERAEPKAANTAGPRHKKSLCSRQDLL